MAVGAITILCSDVTCPTLARAGATDTLGAALEIYRRHGAGAPWLSRIDTDSRRLGVAGG